MLHTKSVIFLLLLAATGSAIADTLSGRVIGVSDGDTLTVLDNTNTQHRIRLAAIDSPEKAQAFGNRAKQALSNICFGKPATITVVDTDRYGRTVGEVNCAGANANEAMLRSGMAWVYRKYAEGYGHFYAIEDEARASKRGLWADISPMPPWEWRKVKRTHSIPRN